MKDLGSLRYFLGIEVIPFSRGHFLLKSKYAQNILQHACVLATKTISTHFALKHHLRVLYSSFSPVDPTSYCNILKTPLCLGKFNIFYIWTPRFFF